MGMDKYGCFMQYMCIISETIVNIQPQIRKSWDSMENSNKKRK